MNRLLVLILVLVLGLALNPGAALAQATGTEPPAPTRAKPHAKGTAKGNRLFYHHAYSDGLFEVALGKLGQEKGTNPQVKELAGMLVTDHTKSNTQLKDVAQRESVELTTHIPQHHEKQLGQLRQLSGDDFDRAFVREVIQVHHTAIALFERQAEHGTDPDAKEFAQSTLPTLRQHLQQAEKIQASLPGGGGATGGTEKGAGARGGATTH